MDKFKLEAANSVFLLIDFQSNLAVAMKKDVYANCENNVTLIVTSCECHRAIQQGAWQYG
jgi:hypothetical protein